jgi:uncharacterized protein (TIGR03435 family)
LLADRFRLTAHREIAEIPAYHMVVDEGGIKVLLEPLTAEVPRPAAPPPQPPSAEWKVLMDCYYRLYLKRPEPGEKRVSCFPGRGIEAYGQTGEWQVIARMSLSGFASSLGSVLDHRVLNKTGLDGMADFDFNANIPESAMAELLKRPGLNTGNGQWPSIFDELRTLGLKLEQGVTVVEFFIVDSIERVPTSEFALVNPL